MIQASYVSSYCVNEILLAHHTFGKIHFFWSFPGPLNFYYISLGE